MELPPFDLCSWNHRFDDPLHQYRTLYCAEEKLTCLREVLAPLRPDIVSVMEASARLGPGWAPAALLTMAWRRQHALAAGQVELGNGELVDLDDVQTRNELEYQVALQMNRAKPDHLDIPVVRGADRELTRKISRFVYEQGFAGIVFGSAIDNKKCAALFEGRARLIPAEETVIPLSGSVPELLTVCAEFGLALRRFK